MYKDVHSNTILNNTNLEVTEVPNAREIVKLARGHPHKEYYIAIQTANYETDIDSHIPRGRCQAL